MDLEVLNNIKKTNMHNRLELSLASMVFKHKVFYETVKNQTLKVTILSILWKHTLNLPEASPIKNTSNFFATLCINKKKQCNLKRLWMFLGSIGSISKNKSRH